MLTETDVRTALRGITRDRAVESRPVEFGLASTAPDSVNLASPALDLDECLDLVASDGYLPRLRSMCSMRDHARRVYREQRARTPSTDRA